MDLMVLVAMVGVGVASLRGVSLVDLSTPALRRDLFGPLLPCGLVWTLAVLLLRLRHPRPARRRLARQPGTVACVAAASVAGAGGLALLLVLTAKFYTRAEPVALTDRFVARLLEGMAPSMGLGVLVAWLMLVLNKTWRPEPSWVDRMGRVVGAFWVATIPVFAWPFGRLVL